MFYCEEYNEKNVANLTKEIGTIKNVDICYLENPSMPILCSLQTMRAKPRYHLYLAEIEKEVVTKSNTETL
jgi:hypothetical protein